MPARGPLGRTPAPRSAPSHPPPPRSAHPAIGAAAAGVHFFRRRHEWPHYFRRRHRHHIGQRHHFGGCHFRLRRPDQCVRPHIVPGARHHRLRRLHARTRWTRVGCIVRRPDLRQLLLQAVPDDLLLVRAGSPGRRSIAPVAAACPPAQNAPTPARCRARSPTPRMKKSCAGVVVPR